MPGAEGRGRGHLFDITFLFSFLSGFALHSGWDFQSYPILSFSSRPAARPRCNHRALFLMGNMKDGTPIQEMEDIQTWVARRANSAK